jgi:hypothetical protein
MSHTATMLWREGKTAKKGKRPTEGHQYPPRQQPSLPARKLKLHHMAPSGHVANTPQRTAKTPTPANTGGPAYDEHVSRSG